MILYCCIFCIIIYATLSFALGDENSVLKGLRASTSHHRSLDSKASTDKSVRDHKYFLWPFYNPEVFNGWWNKDYLNELFPPPFFITGNDTEYPVIDMVLCSGHQHIPEIEKVIARLKASGKDDAKLPVLIHPSDEFLGSNPSTLACTKLYSHFHVVLREYALHGNHPDNVHQLPLGYMFDSLYDNVSSASAPSGWELIRHPSTAYATWSLSKDFHSREFQWAFIGGIHGKGKADRNNALAVFSTWTPHYRGEGVKAHDMVQIYNNSRFVVSGRGWNSLDCYRAYEALIAGALPVIVGSDQELSHSFAFEGHRPPFIYERSWPEALRRCQSMSASEWNSQRNRLVLWYAERVEALRSLAYDAMGLPSPASAAAN